ncbi:MAG TPA: uroporphyrinogen-III C-methyltransferase [Deltaproteobacteria bacterium]|jgi:uroporphyrinogen III methyltransferase/synthase|nr:uroporphyrinogen-III C-methyltransferase [Deltaproteobacteria bacterium]
MSGRTGRVVLVGAGPGDPDLITLRGAAALRSADAVVHDALVSAGLLALAPPEAQRINVGKRGHDEPTLAQEETNALLVRLAQEGKTVVRLKGGDPFVFGRGGEEASALARAGIPFEVVPGVSAAIGVPALAGIPVTDRRHAASFTVVTGHKDPLEPAASMRWGELARGADTLVILMGLKNLEAIAERLVASGRTGRTPSAAIEWGTTPAQRVVEAPLAELAARVAQAGLKAPVTIVIGDVVRLRGELARAERLPLAGLRVLVTRSETQAGGLVTELRRAGAEPLIVPMIQLAPLSATPELAAAIAGLSDYDVLLFTSANAVRCFVAAASAGKGLGALRARVVCVGPATARTAQELGLAVHLVPTRRFDAEGLLEALRLSFPLAGQRILLPRAAAARDLLPEGLRRAGATVDVVAVYRTEAAKVDTAALCAGLVRGEIDALTFTSPSTVRHFMACLDEAARKAVRRCVVAALGPVTAAALRDAGLAPDVVAERAQAGALAQALGEAVRLRAARAAEGGER